MQDFENEATMPTGTNEVAIYGRNKEIVDLRSNGQYAACQ